MQLAVITDEIDEDLEHALDVMAQYGIRSAEIRSVWGKNVASLTAAEVADVRRILDAKNVQAIGIASPVFKCDLPDTESGAVTGPLHGAPPLMFDDQIALLERCIEIAHNLGAPMIRTFTFWKRGSLTPSIADQIVAAYGIPTRLADAAGVTLVVENEHDCMTGTGAETANIVSRIASPSVRVVWDPGNAIFAGEVPFPLGYQAVKPFIAHVHVKDARMDENGRAEWVVVGEGTANWPAQIEALRDDGYDGYLSLETHYSGGGSKESSSRQCLDALRRMVPST